MRINEVIDKQDLKLLKLEWNILQTSDPEGIPRMAAKGPPKYNPQRTAKVSGMPNYEKYPTVTSTKPEIKAMVADPKNSNLKLFFYILAWGGIVNRARNPQMLVRRLMTDKVARTELLKTLERIRRGNLTNAQAFDEFQRLRKNKTLQGVGVSYFTKVLYFLRPGQNSFILDQFTAKAMNYLHSKDPVNYPQIPMDGDMPANNLTGQDYEAYIKGVAQVAKDVKKSIGQISPEEAEFLVFGAYGKKFRDASEKYHASRTDLKKPKDNKFRYIYRAQQAKQDKEQQAQQQAQQSQLSQTSGQAQSLWNQYMQTANPVSQKYRSLSSDSKPDFQQEFIDDVAEALRKGVDPQVAIKQLLVNYSDITESKT